MKRMSKLLLILNFPVFIYILGGMSLYQPEYIRYKILSYRETPSELAKEFAVELPYMAPGMLVGAVTSGMGLCPALTLSSAVTAAILYIGGREDFIGHILRMPITTLQTLPEFHELAAKGMDEPSIRLELGKTGREQAGIRKGAVGGVFALLGALFCLTRFVIKKVKTRRQPTDNGV